MKQPGPEYSVIVEYRKLPDGEVVTQVVKDANEIVIPAGGPGEEYEVYVQPQNQKGTGPKTGPFTFKSGSPSKYEVTLCQKCIRCFL